MLVYQRVDCDPMQWESKYVWVYECICAHRATECTKANEVSIIYLEVDGKKPPGRESNTTSKVAMPVSAISTIKQFPQVSVACFHAVFGILKDLNPVPPMNNNPNPPNWQPPPPPDSFRRLRLFSGGDRSNGLSPTTSRKLGLWLCTPDTSWVISSDIQYTSMGGRRFSTLVQNGANTSTGRKSLRDSWKSERYQSLVGLRRYQLSDWLSVYKSLIIT